MTVDHVDSYNSTVYGTDYNVDGLDLTYGAGPQDTQAQLSLQLVNEGTLGMFAKGTNELIVVKDWGRCEMQLNPDGTMSLTRVGIDQWETGTQMRAFCGDQNELASRSEWRHRRKRMASNRSLPDVRTREGRIVVAEEALQVVEHITGDNPEA